MVARPSCVLFVSDSSGGVFFSLFSNRLGRFGVARGFRFPPAGVLEGFLSSGFAGREGMASLPPKIQPLVPGWFQLGGMTVVVILVPFTTTVIEPSVGFFSLGVWDRVPSGV